MQTVERPFFAIFLRLLAALAIGTLMMLVKLASNDGISMPEIIFWRQVLTIPALLIGLGLAGQLHRLKTQRLRTHALRATISTLGMASLFGAAILLSLPQASVLTFTSPFFAVLFTAFILRETVGVWRWASVAIGFCGVLVLAQPGAEHVDPLGALAGLTAALIVVIVSYQLKDLARTDEPIACVFYLAVFSSLYIGVLLPFYAQNHTTHQWLLLLAIGVAGLASQYLLTMSLKYGAVATILIMDYTLLLWATVYSWLIWNDLPHPSTWVGAPLIITAGIIITLRERLNSRSPSPVSAAELK